MKTSLARTPSHPTRIVFVTTDSPPVQDFDAKKGKVAVRYEGSSTIIYVGLGDTATPHAVRTAAAKGVQRAIELKRTDVSIVVPKSADQAEALSQACTEGAILGAYSFAKYRAEPPRPVKRLEICGSSLSASDVARIATICDCVNYARDLVNENASIVFPEALAKEARTIAGAPHVKATVLDEKAIAKKGLGLLEAVGRGSPYPPRLIILEYTGNARSKQKTAIVGKGITFDSGGVNLKPSGSVETMREDMAGAAATLATIKAAAALHLPVNLVGVVAAAHNAIDGRSYFPGDVYRSYAGTTVEITNTDAEGRLVLADAITYCRKHYAPTRMIDLATLTGGVLTALGEYVAGLFSNDDDLSSAISVSGDRTFERVWRFPVYEESAESMKSDIADLRNTSKFKKGYASSICGAAFLQEFVRDIPWAHLDIAGTAFNEGEARGEIPKYGTGFGVRLLVDLLSRDAQGSL